MKFISIPLSKMLISIVSIPFFSPVFVYAGNANLCYKSVNDILENVVSLEDEYSFGELKVFRINDDDALDAYLGLYDKFGSGRQLSLSIFLGSDEGLCRLAMPIEDTGLVEFQPYQIIPKNDETTNLVIQIEFHDAFNGEAISKRYKYSNSTKEFLLNE